MKTRRGMLMVLSLWACASAVGAADMKPKELPRSSPEAQGIASSAILGFVDAAEAKVDALHSFMLLRHGQVVAEGWWAPYTASDPHMLFSLSKSFTSSAVGLAVSEGLMTIDDPVLPYFPDVAPAAPSANLKALRVRDLLSMSSGQDQKVLDAILKAPDGQWTKAFLAAPVDFKPGTHFVYNTPGTYMLSAIVQKVSGKTVLDYLRPRLFEPLGIDNPTWGASPQGITLGGYGLSLKTEDVARFGQLYLQKGEWQGQRLLPVNWIAAATARQTSNGSSPTSDWDQGYGYQFWRCRHGLYRGDGAHGQFCIVMPEQDAVIAITSGTRDMQSVMNAVWDNLLPAMQAAPLPADTATQEQLQRRLAALSLRPVTGQATSPLARKVSAKTYVFPANDQKVEALSLQFDKQGATLSLRQAGAEQQAACGNGVWRKGRTVLTEDAEQPVAASGAWTSADTYKARLCFYETPFCTTLGLRFDGDQVFLDVERNIEHGSKYPPLVGQALSAVPRRVAR